MSGLFGVLVPTNPHPPSTSGMSQVSLLLVLLILCGYTKVWPPLLLAQVHNASMLLQSLTYELYFLNTMRLFHCSSPLLTHWSLSKSSGAATKTNAWTTSVLQNPPQVSLFGLGGSGIQTMERSCTDSPNRSPLQGRFVTGPLTCMPAGQMDFQEQPSMCHAHGSCPGTAKVCVS